MFLLRRRQEWRRGFSWAPTRPPHEAGRGSDPPKPAGRALLTRLPPWPLPCCFVSLKGFAVVVVYFYGPFSAATKAFVYLRCGAVQISINLHITSVASPLTWRFVTEMVPRLVWGSQHRLGNCSEFGVFQKLICLWEWKLTPTHAVVYVISTYFGICAGKERLLFYFLLNLKFTSCSRTL